MGVSSGSSQVRRRTNTASMNAPASGVRPATSRTKKTICNQPFVVMTASEALWREQRDDEVDEECSGDEQGDEEARGHRLTAPAGSRWRTHPRPRRTAR